MGVIIDGMIHPASGLTPNGLVLPNPKPQSGACQSLGIATTPLYTCPPGRRALWRSVTGVNLASGSGNISWNTLVQIPAQPSFFISPSVSNAVGTFTVLNRAICLEAGQSATISTFGHAGLHVIFDIVEFDASALLHSVLFSNFVAGNNTLYTVPAGKGAIFVDPMTGTITQGMYDASLNQYAGTSFAYMNLGTARTYNLFVVPNGGTPGSVNQVTPNFTPAPANVNQMLQLLMTMGSGDSFVMNVDAGPNSQYAWCNVIEV